MQYEVATNFEKVNKQTNQIESGIGVNGAKNFLRGVLST